MVDESKDDTGSVPEESSDSEAPAVTPLEVKVTNTPVREKHWNDEVDDIEYERIILTKEDMDI